MPRWDVCEIEQIDVSESESGGRLFSKPVRSETKVWVAEQYSPNGGRTRIMQTSGWTQRQVKGSDGMLLWKLDDPSRGPSFQFTGLVAQLGLEGWEPMPISVAGTPVGATSGVVLHVKRQLPDL